MIKLYCEQCHTEFEKTDYFIRAELKKNANHKFFCSKKCVYQNRTHLKKVTISCRVCKKECITDENDLKRNKNYYCSWKCYEIQRNIGKSLVDLICPTCKTTFQNSINQINGKKRKGAKNIFCSSKCSSEAQRNDYSKDFLLKCDYCDKDIIKTGRQMKITKFHFCNPSCKGSYFARLYAFGAKRSQLEEKIEAMIKKTFPNLPYLVNDREILKGLELDFYFPSLNFAIEVNGPAHYTPVYGDESLLRTQRNDIIKKNYCKKKQIRLLEITETLHPYNDNSKAIYENHILPILTPLVNNNRG